MNRRNFGTGSPWEDQVGYSRAVLIGNTIEIAGTVARLGDQIIGKDDAYAQTKSIIEKIESVLKQAGSSLDDVVRTRIYVKDISKWEEIGKAHGEFFSRIKPASTIIEVSNLIDEDYLVEIEATAIKLS